MAPGFNGPGAVRESLDRAWKLIWSALNAEIDPGPVAFVSDRRDCRSRLLYVINPRELYPFGKDRNFSATATYSIGFFAFWILCAASSLVTLFFQRSADEVNHPERT